MQKCYLNIQHSSLYGKKLHESYEIDSHELRLLPAETIADAFLSCEQSNDTKTSTDLDNAYPDISSSNA